MYQPHRTERYEYATDLIEYIEDRHCKSCIFSVPTEVSTMCEVQFDILLERPVEFMEEVDGIVFCNKWCPHAPA